MRRFRLAAAGLAFILLALPAAAAAGVQLRGIDASAYPVGAANWLKTNGYFSGQHRVAEQDVVGCYLDLRFGRRGTTFIDDRVDMFPVSVSDDYYQLLTGGPRALEVLQDDGIDVVVWRDDKPLTALLRATGAWDERSRANGWVVSVRR